MDERGIERAVLAGASMGAHTLLRFALEYPERAAALVVITPAYDPVDNDDPERLARWDALAEGLRTGGVEGFVEAYGDPGVPEAWRETVFKVLRQRLSAHEHPEAVADALHAVPRSRPFGTLHDLAAIEAPTVIVADRDEADPGHPLSVGEDYARVDPGRAAGGGGAGPLADRVAGRPAVEGHRGGHRGGGALSSAPSAVAAGLSPAVGARARAPASSPS